uniref:Reverse transcriptase domain-containing protein n=1 Tax=Cajanus cajan TaxID=3821 RepID=A0A151R3T4_CAJCA|nr:hypothetical protein KK1_041617 [Cajanus cajan]
MSAKLSLLCNGECLESFSPKRGLRQASFCWGLGSPLSHLFFVDNVLWFSKATPSHIRMVTESLQRFYNASGLKVNLTKSRMMASKGVPRSKKNSLTQITRSFSDVAW